VNQVRQLHTTRANTNTDRSAGAGASTKRGPRVVSITSGKGGVGKTLTTVNFAVVARKMGYSVTILDGDLGMANVDIVLGVQARYNIKEVLDGHVSLKDIIVEGPLGIRVIPSGSGISGLSNLTCVQKQNILDQINQLDEQSDLLLIDTGAGISETVMTLNSSADHVVVVTTPEPHAMTDAYALMKVLSEERGVREVSLLVNQTKSPDEGQKTADRLKGVAAKFLRLEINYVGHVPADVLVARSVMQRRAATEQSVMTLGGQAWSQISRTLLTDLFATSKDDSNTSVWQSLLWSDAMQSAVAR